MTRRVIWKDIPGPKKAVYQISTSREVRNKNSGRVLQSERLANGYICVTMFSGPATKIVPIHKLFAAAYCSDPVDRTLGWHLDASDEDLRAAGLDIEHREV
jgi:hypothetical protein